MPRTKRTSKTSRNTSSSTLDKTSRKQEINEYIKQFDSKCKFLIQAIDTECESVISDLQMLTLECKTLLPPHILNTTLEDLPNVLTEASSCFITVSETASCSNFLEITNAIKSVKRKKDRRSRSAGDDEAENSANSGASHASRSQIKQPRGTIRTRSLSKNKSTLNVVPLESYKTPASRAPKSDFGLVTPKIKPNTPQVIMRRPKEGEMAISMQGSPLLVNTIVSREANVNIPLGDGKTISILPQRGIRMSELPTIDADIRQQIEALRDNLIKVCESTSFNKKKK